MKLSTEIVDEKQKSLIVSKRDYHFISILKNELKRVSISPFSSPFIPKNIKMFNYIFVINESISLEQVDKNKNSIFIHIFFGKKNQSVNTKFFPKNIKIISVNGNHLEKDEIDKILWFAISKSEETVLNLNLSQLVKKKINFTPDLSLSYKKFVTKKNLIYFSILTFVTIHLAFIPFLMLSFYFDYQNYLALKKNSSVDINNAVVTNNISKKLYSIVRPTYLLFGIAILPDNLTDINEKSQTIIKQAQSLINDFKGLEEIFFQQQKTLQQKSVLNLRIQKIKNSLTIIEEDLDVIAQKIPIKNKFFDKIKEKLIEQADNIRKAQKIIDYFQKTISQEKISKYVIFFANNMELRPGGGFIGSFGIFEIGNYSIGEIKVYDIYDADGQLTVHLEPPKPISQYLNVPHWFFRDSNFSPDFFTNYQKALFFLEREMKMTDFSGGILITTTAVENILYAFNDLYLPDFKEYINAKNFYLKTQLYVEKKFFPGSIQKKTFLSSIVRQIKNNIDTVDIKTLFSQVKKSLDEKQIVVFFEDQNFQSLFDSSYWSGRVIEPKCTLSKNCVIDYVFPYDANVGANKANFFINRFFNLKIKIDAQGKISHLLSLQYKNDSPAEIFPTGYYRNYFQILLPKNSILDQITKDGVQVENIDQIDEKYKQIGFFFELAPGKTTDIKISYQLNEPIKKGTNIYQLVVQKQTGAKNSDLILEFELNKSISILNQNFSPIVKDNQIIYNTNLLTDKIFFIELTKE
ncbi:MAG: DUF4012 domain-containing protein [Candidatus Roizmanbacteria bacterium]|nr:DUF4012 domain-containing protein [Candidatus Roizmanbacteria bacterium]MCR4313282.1 DUF4012 domain-containing protein [Candidatus Roizmanbacteria bacterium]